MRGPKKSKEIITSDLCSYGCGHQAKFINNTGRLMCGCYATKCPANRKKNSEAISLAHKQGRCLRASNLTSEHRANAKGKRFAVFGCPGSGQFKNALISERGHVCEQCKGTEWLNVPIPLELEHVDGNRRNNTRENLKLLCPNCHALTNTWRGRNINTKQKNISDEDFIQALSTTKNIRQALLKLGLTPKGLNYRRAHELLMRA